MNTEDEFDSPDDQLAPWVVAGFDGECSCGLDDIMEGDIIRADGTGGWVRKECVDDLRDVPLSYRGWKEGDDERNTAQQMIRSGELRRDYR
jgi:hypothetical protein